MAVSHPVFARLFARASVAMDRAGAAAHRRRLVAGLRGRVVEVQQRGRARHRLRPDPGREVPGRGGADRRLPARP
ncbi:SAM-dependent methyltransferase, partial [Micromonospora sp. NPDC003776]